MRHDQTPLFAKLIEHSKKDPSSFHVPGHKNGAIFPASAQSFYNSILSLDMTELPGFDDLHAPHHVILEAEELAADFFRAEQTFFLVGGSTAGNLAMILATCSAEDKIIVQRNCHKSVFNALELCGAMPVFVTPEYDHRADRYTAPDTVTIRQALQLHPDAKAVVLTYPDYFGKTFAIKEMIDGIHEYNIPVLVDEAHGVHFSLGDPFPASSLRFGADAVVQSAHKMAPAMTMSAYLHLNSSRIDKQRLAHYLQMIQSSSPSYPLMASLDIARSFLALLTKKDISLMQDSVYRLRKALASVSCWKVISCTPADDLLKITLHMNHGQSGYQVARLFEQENIYPELATDNHVLFIHGLAPFERFGKMEKALEIIHEQLKNSRNNGLHATIDITKLYPEKMQELALSYQEMNKRKTILIPIKQATGYVAAEAVIPYPPGIPLVLKGERIKETHLDAIDQLLQQHALIQHNNINKGIHVFARD